MRIGDIEYKSEYNNNTLLSRVQNLIDSARSETREVDRNLLIAIRQALKYPLLPEEPTDDLLNVIREASTSSEVYRSLRKALLAPPKPKTKTVWCVSFAIIKGVYAGNCDISEFPTKELADRQRDEFIKQDHLSHISPVFSVEVPNEDCVSNEDYL